MLYTVAYCASFASQTQPTPVRIAFSIMYGEGFVLKVIHTGVGCV